MFHVWGTCTAESSNCWAGCGERARQRNSPESPCEPGGSDVRPTAAHCRCCCCYYLPNTGGWDSGLGRPWLGRGGLGRKKYLNPYICKAKAPGIHTWSITFSRVWAWNSRDGGNTNQTKFPRCVMTKRGSFTWKTKRHTRENMRDSALNILGLVYKSEGSGWRRRWGLNLLWKNSIPKGESKATPKTPY